VLFDDLAYLLDKTALPLDHPIGEIGPIDVADDDARRMETELPRDVVPHGFGGRGCEGVDGYVFEFPFEKAELPVFLPEVVAPVAYAMRLVHDEISDPDGFER